jgi:hypothetical protein
MFDQAEARDPTHRRCWVVLVDGACHQLDLIRAEAARRHVTVHIVIDFHSCNWNICGGRPGRSTPTATRTPKPGYSGTP